VRKHRGEAELDSVKFLKLVKEKMALLKMDPSFMNRAVNEGFSGGEKKRNEVFQMAVMNPFLGLMDETDSGLDIDALKIVSQGANSLRSPERAILIVTHYQRLLTYIQPDYVHVMMDGRIVKTGDKGLALELEEKGYDWVEKEVAAAV
jgi:Fe-S cluster assembly ATP-binding protein